MRARNRKAAHLVAGDHFAQVFVAAEAHARIGQVDAEGIPQRPGLRYGGCEGREPSDEAGLRSV